MFLLAAILFRAIEMTRAIFFLSVVLLVGYAKGNTIRENAEDAIVEEFPIPLDEVESNNLEAPANPLLVTLQGVNPPRQCAGVGQAVSVYIFLCE